MWDFHVLWLSFFITLSATQSPNESIQGEELRKFFVKYWILDSKQRTSSYSSRNLILPPKYMIDLYQEEASRKEGPDQTTRCILGSIRRERLEFNLSSVREERDGNIWRAEVHFFRRKSGSRGKGPRMKFFLAHYKNPIFIGRKFLRNGKIRLKRSTSGWEGFDITNIIKKSERKWEIVGVSFEGLFRQFGTGKTTYHRLRLEDQIKIKYRPFILIFSAFRSSWGSNGIESSVQSNRISPLTSQAQEQISKEKVQDHDNKINNQLTRINPRIIRKRGVQAFGNFTKIRIGGKRTRRKKTQIPMKYRPGKPLYKSKPRFPLDLSQQYKGIIQTSGKMDENTSQTHECNMQRAFLQMNFKWTEHILAPTSFPINSCIGFCYNTENSPLQSNIVGLEYLSMSTRLSSSCVPSHFTRLSILYVDAFDSIVLKSIENGTVGGCFCS